MGIIVKGARVNNLKDITLEIPRGKFIVITGVSGSGKSSLAFDTLYAEGQRRYAESLSSYARQFLGRMSKPDVDNIEGIPPAIAIEQKVSTKNPRSTIATTTEIYDFLRLIYARIGRTFSPVSGREVHCDTVTDVMDHISGLKDGETFYILADVGWNSRDDRVELLLQLKEQGYNRLFSSGRPVKIDDVLQAGMPGDAWLLIDRARSVSEMDSDLRTRLLSSINDAFESGKGTMAVALDNGEVRVFCNRFELDGITFRQPDEFLFSFNSPLGACPVCGGLGKIIGVSEDLVIPDKTKSIYDGCIACWRGEKMGWFRDHLIEVAERYGIPVFEPYCNLDRKTKDLIWEGDRPAPGERYDDDESRLVGINEFFEWVETQRYKIQYKYMLSRFSGRTICHECHGSRLRKEALYVKVGGRDISELLDMNVGELLKFMQDLELTEEERSIVREPLQEILNRLQYIEDVGLGYLTMSRACNTLSGGESQRINLVTALGSSLVGSMYVLDEPSIGLHPRDTERLIAVLRRLRDLGNTVIVVEHDEEIIRAADLLIDMGPGAGAAGGRIVFQGIVPAGSGMAAGDQKSGVMAPDSHTTTCLHPTGKEVKVPCDNSIGDLKTTGTGVMAPDSHTTTCLEPAEKRQDDLSVSSCAASDQKSGGMAIGNPATDRQLNSLMDGAGVSGGHSPFVLVPGGTGTVHDEFGSRESLTLKYLSGEMPRYTREKRPWTYSITVEGAMEHNLKDIDVKFPLGVLTVVTGVSGSGKSSLVGDILYPALFRKLNDSGDLPGTHRGLSGNLDRISRVEYVDQNPIGRSSRSNAVTYLKVYDQIRTLLSNQQYAKINGFGPSTFSFNQEGGRCPECQGDGYVKIEMQFMADVTMVCESCGGKRFKPDVLEVRYRGRNIDDILNMSVDEAIGFFAVGEEEDAREIASRLQPLVDVGLGYIKLGQSSSTLSGGESQRIKLAYFLSISRKERKSEKILFIFDEPTTGLHFHDVGNLLKSFDALLAAGHSLVVVEHNPDVIRAADWVIDLGPDAGDRGGKVVFAGTPEELKGKNTFTARFI